jgi:hypothetical protein
MIATPVTVGVFFFFFTVPDYWLFEWFLEMSTANMAFGTDHLLVSCYIDTTKLCLPLRMRQDSYSLTTRTSWFHAQLEGR